MKESQVIQGDNFPIVDLKAYNTKGKDAQFIQLNQVFEHVTGDKKSTEDTIQKVRVKFYAQLEDIDCKINGCRTQTSTRRNETGRITRLRTNTERYSRSETTNGG